MTRIETVVMLPLAAAAIVVMAFIAAEASGARPFAVRPLTLSEAAAEGDAPSMMRALHAGASPLERHTVQRDVIASAAGLRLTPFEAAVLTDRSDTLGLLLGWGAPLDGEQRTHLRCLADAVGADDSRQLLGDAPARCEDFRDPRQASAHD